MINSSRRFLRRKISPGRSITPSAPSASICFTQTVNVKGLMTHKVFDAAQFVELGNQTTGAVTHCFTCLRTARLPHFDSGQGLAWPSMCWTFVLEPKDLRYDVAGTLNRYRIPNSDIFFNDVIFIMKGRIGDDNASYGYWI